MSLQISNLRPETLQPGSRALAACCAASIGLLALLLVPAPATAQFTEWDSFPVNGLFSVTAALRGLNSEGGPQVRMEALVGYNAGAGNRFDYHSSAPIDAPVIPDRPVNRRADTHDPVDWTDSGVQPSLNGMCCSNYGRGLDDDRSLHYVTNPTGFLGFEVEIGVPALGVTDMRQRELYGLEDGSTEDDEGSTPPGGTPGGDSGTGGGSSDSNEIDHNPEGPEGSFSRVMVTTRFPGNGVKIHSNSGAGGSFVFETEIPDCRGVQSNWHFYRAGSLKQNEYYVACVTTANNLAVKRVDRDTYAVSQVVLNTGLPAASGIFAYTQVTECSVDSGTVVGVLEPRADLGITNFYAVFLGNAGGHQGTATIQLPGARPNRQAFTCIKAGKNAQFLLHGRGAVATNTDTFFIQVNSAALTELGGESMLVRSTTETRRTDWATTIPSVVRTSAGGRIRTVYQGPRPVVEADFGPSSEVRYGTVEVPLFADDFESGDLRYWDQVVN